MRTPAALLAAAVLALLWARPARSQVAAPSAEAGNKPDFPVWVDDISSPESPSRWLPLESGAVKVRPGTPPRIELPADGKLAAVGVVQDPADPANFAVGARWDYSRAALNAVAAMEPGIPDAENLARKWAWPDQSVAELGRSALPALRDAAAGEMRMAALADEAATRALLRRACRANAGPRAIRAAQMAALDQPQWVRDVCAAQGVEPAPFLAGTDVTLARLKHAISALQPGWPQSVSDPEAWPEAERILIGELGLGCARALEELAAAEPAYAGKLAWVQGEIRRRAAVELVERYIAQAAAGQMPEGFDLAADAPDDLWVLAACKSELDGLLESAELRHGRLAAGDADQAAEASLLRPVLDLLKKSLAEAAGAAPAAEGALGRARQALAAGKDPRADFLADAGHEHALGLLVRARARAMALCAKHRWLAAMIAVREKDPRQGYDAGKGVNPANSGRAWDAQHGIENFGAGVELRAPVAAPPVRLEPGRSYLIEYRVKALNLEQGNAAPHRLAHQAAWLELMPLDLNGQPLPGTMGAENNDGLEEGRLLPFAFARSGSGAVPRRHLDTSDGEAGWLPVRALLPQVPDTVAGFTLRVVVSNLLGEGAVLFDSFRLTRVADSLDEDFEGAFGEATEGVPPGWQRVRDAARNRLPYSRINVDKQVAAGGRRSLRIEPAGFNVALQTQRSFPLLPDRDYTFEASLRCADLGGMKAWFELHCLSAGNEPVTPDGLPDPEGAWPLRTAVLGDSPGSLGWQRFATHEQWQAVRLSLARRITAPALPTDERLPVARLRVRLVIEGTEPSHAARIWVDDVRLREEPGLRVSQGLLREGQFFAKSGPMRTAAPGDDGERAVRLRVTGLPPRAGGWHMRVHLADGLGGRALAWDSLAGQPPDALLRTDDTGALETPTLLPGRLGLAGNVGVFAAEVDLTRAGRVIRRTASFAVLAPVAAGGDAGITLDAALGDSHVAELLEASTGAFTSVPLWAGDATAETLAQHPLMLRAMRLSRSPRLGIPLGLLESAPGSASCAQAWSAPGGARVHNLLRATVGALRDRFPAYQLGPYLGAGWEHPQAEPAAALDAARTVLAAGNAPWVQLVLPWELGADEDALSRGFAARWPQALRADPRVAAALDPGQLEALLALQPGCVLLRDTERLNVVVPRELTGAQLRTALAVLAGRVGSFEAPLGRTPQAVRANAQALLAGGLWRAADPALLLGTIELGDGAAGVAALADAWTSLADAGITRFLCARALPGLLAEDAGPAPALAAWRTLASTLAGARPFALDLNTDLPVRLLQRPDASCILAVLAGTSEQEQLLPLGHDVREQDLMGNIARPAGGSGGNVAVRVGPGRLPRFFAGLDVPLLRTLASLAVTAPLQAELRRQPLTLELGNQFAGELLLAPTVTAPAGLLLSEGSSAEADRVSLPARKLAPAARGELTLQARPLPVLGTDDARLAVRLVFEAAGRSYDVTQPVAVPVQARLAVRAVQWLSGDEVDELVVTVFNGGQGAESFVLDLRVDGAPELDRRGRGSAAAGAEVQLRYRLPRANAALNGRTLRLALSQSPGTAFANISRRIGLGADGRATLS
ncbi:MAG: hypothetical protein IT463_02375 [Planctomycetes bacterium]|nr:hypothetical protein [Planctomycetota bacterium]